MNQDFQNKSLITKVAGININFTFHTLSFINMLTYCLKCKNKTENVDSKMLKTKNTRKILSSKCAIVKNQDS